jgi:hypothetical protein
MMAPTAAIESVLRELRNLPTRVGSWRVETGPDATDGSAVWVWATLEEENVDAATRARLRDTVREAVRRASEAAPWVYVRFRTASETQ